MGAKKTARSGTPCIVYLRSAKRDLHLAVAEEVTLEELSRRLPDALVVARDLTDGLPPTGVDCVIVDGSSLLDLEPASVDFTDLLNSPPVIPAVVWQGVRLPRDGDERRVSAWAALLQHARLVTVCDVDSRERLQARCGDLRIDLHPTPGLLLPRIVAVAMAERRLSSLQARSAYPTDGKTLLIELAGGDTAGEADFQHSFSGQ